MQKTILVIGATGLLGKPVAEKLQEKGFQVRILARKPEKAQSIFPESFEILPGNITDPQSLATAMEGCQGVHFSVAGDSADNHAGAVASAASPQTNREHGYLIFR